MIHIAICVNDLFISSYITNIFYKFIGKNNILIEDFSNYMDLISHNETNSYYQIIFMELIPHDLTDTTIRTHLISQKNSLLIYIIHHEFHAKELSYIIETHPFSSIVHPFSKKELLSKFWLAYQHIFNDAHFFHFKNHNTSFCIPFNDILYFEKNGRIIYIHTINNNFCYYADINNLYTYLLTHTNLFVRIQYSYIINLKYISKFNKHKVYIQEKCFSISKKYSEDLFFNCLKL